MHTHLLLFCHERSRWWTREHCNAHFYFPSITHHTMHWSQLYCLKYSYFFSLCAFHSSSSSYHAHTYADANLKKFMLWLFDAFTCSSGRLGFLFFCSAMLIGKWHAMELRREGISSLRDFFFSCFVPFAFWQA